MSVSSNDNPTWKDVAPLIVDMDAFEKGKHDAKTMTTEQLTVEAARMVDRGAKHFYDQVIEEEVGPPPEKQIEEAEKQWKTFRELVSGETIRKPPKQLINEMVEEKRAERRAEEARPRLVEGVINDVSDSWRQFIRIFNRDSEKTR